MANTMRAWVQQGFGGQEVRVLADVPVPVPAADDVLVRVSACALNRLDVLQRRAPVIPVFRLPHIGGMDIYGEVVRSGGPEGDPLLGETVVLDPVVVCLRCDHCCSGHTEYCRELRTVGSTRDGGLAEFVVVPARNCIPVSAGALSPEEYASIPVASVTAWHAVVTVGKALPGEVVVVPGAGSGVGGAGVLIAKSIGATVITTVGTPDKIEAATSLGADLVIDRSGGAWWEQVLDATDGRGADLVIDHVGGEFLQQAIDATRIDGRIVMSGTTAGDRSEILSTRLFHWGKRILGHGGYSPQELRDVVHRYECGELRPLIDSTFPFEGYLDAEARLESGGFSGKVVMCVG